MFIVRGGVFADTTFTKLGEGEKEERYGPFETYEKAREVWKARSSWKVDICEHRLFIKQEAATAA